MKRQPQQQKCIDRLIHHHSGADSLFPISRDKLVTCVLPSICHTYISKASDEVMEFSFFFFITHTHTQSGENNKLRDGKTTIFIYKSEKLNKEKLLNDWFGYEV